MFGQPQRRVVCLAVVVVLGLTTTARADDFWRRLAQGLTWLGWDIQANEHFLRDGWQVNSRRLFQNETFDFSTHDFLLNGPIVVQGGFAKRFIPTVDLRINTQGQNLRWAYNMNTGIQDALIDSQLNVNVALNMNLLGFYDLDVDITNRGGFQIDGFFLVDDGSTDFDIGPLSLSGNIYLDIIQLAANPLGLPTLGSLISGRATKPWNETPAPRATVVNKVLRIPPARPVTVNLPDVPAAGVDVPPEEIRRQLVLAVLERLQERPVFRLFAVLTSADGAEDDELASIRALLQEWAEIGPRADRLELADLLLHPVILPWEETILFTEQGNELTDPALAPEPASLTLLLGGLVAAALRKTRRR